MWILTETMISISQMNSELNSVIQVTQKYGSAIIMKNNEPVYITFEPDDFKTEEMPKISMREASRNLSKLTYILYDSGFCVVTKRNKPILVIYDFNVIKNSELGLFQMVKFRSDKKGEEKIC